jgi:hypothetical protein
VIVSIRAMILSGKGRLEAAVKMKEDKYDELLEAAQRAISSGIVESSMHWNKSNHNYVAAALISINDPRKNDNEKKGTYSASEAKKTFDAISDMHKEKGWSEYWAKKG